MSRLRQVLSVGWRFHPAPTPTADPGSSSTDDDEVQELSAAEFKRQSTRLVRRGLEVQTVTKGGMQMKGLFTNYPIQACDGGRRDACGKRRRPIRGCFGSRSVASPGTEAAASPVFSCAAVGISARCSGAPRLASKPAGRATAAAAAVAARTPLGVPERRAGVVVAAAQPAHCPLG